MALTLNEGKDPEDGSDMNAVRRLALELLNRTIDDLTDVEVLARAPDEFWFIDLCIDKLHRLTSEIEALITCREYTMIQAYHLVKRAHETMQRRFSDATGPKGLYG